MRDRLARLVERYLIPWYSRDDAEAAMAHNEALRQRSIAARKKAEATTARVEAGGLGVGLREGYRQTGQRLAR